MWRVRIYVQSIGCCESLRYTSCNHRTICSNFKVRKQFAQATSSNISYCRESSQFLFWCVVQPTEPQKCSLLLLPLLLLLLLLLHYYSGYCDYYAVTTYYNYDNVDDDYTILDYNYYDYYYHDTTTTTTTTTKYFSLRGSVLQSRQDPTMLQQAAMVDPYMRQLITGRLDAM